MAFLLHNSIFMRNNLVIGSLFLLCLLPGCDTLPFPTGINGVAIVETGGGNVFPPPPVSHEPLEGAVITVQPDHGGQEIARQIADPNGGFRIELPPGTYLLVAQPPQDSEFVLTPPEQTVVVTPNRLTQVVIDFAVVSHF